MNWQDIALKAVTTILTGAVIGLIVAYYTARYALNRFYQEKWWEKRLAAFTELTDLAYKIKRAEDYWYAHMCAQRGEDDSFQTLSPEDEEALLAEFKFAIKELTRISHLASFTLSVRTSDLLSEYLKAYNAIYPSWWDDEIDNNEAVERSSVLIDDLLPSLLKEAKKELNLPA